MNAKRTILSKESKTTLFRWAGVSAVAAGLGFLIVGMFHPVNVPSAVTTAAWVNVHIAAVAMCFFGLFGMAGLYARQAKEAGWMGLAGFALFSVWMGLVIGFSFVEAFILPILSTESPAFVEGFLGIFTGAASQIDFGVLPTLWQLSGPMYIAGPLLFGIATFRAGILPRGAGALLILSAALVPVGAVVPPEYQSRIMVPIGLALVWLGHALWAERRAKAYEPVSVTSAAAEPGRAA